MKPKTSYQETCAFEELDDRAILGILVKLQHLSFVLPQFGTNSTSPGTLS